jgi:tRNA(Arg) A34 adenosine deaminase TadA
LNFDWADLAFASKKPLRELNAVFIAAPRELSKRRFAQLLKAYLPKGNVVLGLAKEPYVVGLEDQPWFRMLQAAPVQEVIDRVNQSDAPHRVYTLSYGQRDLPFILEKIPFQHVVLINGSWYHAFHQRPEFYQLIQSRTPYTLVPAFADEDEAKRYAAGVPEPNPLDDSPRTEIQMLELATEAACFSLDYGGYQIGVALGRRTEDGLYTPLLRTFNRVVPYQTYAMQHGAAREQHFSPTNDLNHYDTNHAEVEALIAAGRQGLDLRAATVFINVLPCPTCARMFTSTDVTEIVYSEDHSAGYAIKMLEAAGKTVRRVVP